jgi:hypothetical protein
MSEQFSQFIFLLACRDKVIHLSTDKHGLSRMIADVQTRLVGSGCEVQLG